MASQPLRTALGDRGDAVKAWQVFLASQGFDPGMPDGIHGQKTEAASLAFEAKASKPAQAAASIQFLKARNYRPAQRKQVDWVVLHSTENPIRPGTAKSVARYFQGPSAPMASSHYVVGPEEVWQCVPEEDIAFAAPGANEKGIQIEMVGQAARTEWSKAGSADTDGLDVMTRTAKLVAHICAQWSIPVERLDSAALLAGKRGLTTHATVTAAFKRSNHIDPGLTNDIRWPWAQFLELVKAA